MSLATDWKTPLTVASVDRDTKHPWANLVYVQADDGDYVQCDVTKESYSDWLRLTNFAFTTADVPAGSTIDGIEVKIQRKGEVADRISDSAIYLRDTVGQTGDNKASAVKWATTEEEVTRGASDDDWNAGLSAADVINIAFGVDVSAANSDADDDKLAYIDVVFIRIHYTVMTPAVTTGDATEVDEDSGKTNGNVTDDKGLTINERGFDWKQFTSPTGFEDPDTKWGDEAKLYDNDLETHGVDTDPGAGNWGWFVNLIHASLNIISVRYYGYYGEGIGEDIDIDAYYDANGGADWHGVYQGIATFKVWTIYPHVASAVTKIRVRCHHIIGSAQLGFWEIDFGVDEGDWTEDGGGDYGEGAFDHTFEGLTTGDHYMFRAKAHNSAGWGYGEWKEFTPASLTQTIYPDAIASTEAFGTSKLNLKVTPSAISSLEAFGTAKLNQRIFANAISSLEAFGVAKINQRIIAQAIASAEAFGIGKVNQRLFIIAIPSEEAFGDAIVILAKKIAQAILDELLAAPGVTDLTGERIYYVKAPQDVETPYVVFFTVSALREHDHDGASMLATARFQFSIFSPVYREAKQIAEQIQSVLQGFSGTMGGSGGVSVGGSFHQGETDFWEEDTKLYHVACDYTICHQE